tara:strand:- start:1013 stop:1282 length:270 start_codon:yes stop_codon:yes gene_type:complete
MGNIEQLTNDEHAVCAACMNAVLLRCNQLGRAFFSAEDARAVDMTARTLMYLEKIDVPDAARLDAPQTLPQHAELKAYRAIEDALASVG